LDQFQVLRADPSGPALHVSSADDDDGVLPVGHEHDDGVPRGRVGRARNAVGADAAGVGQRALEEPPVCVVPHARHQVGGAQREPPAAGRLVGALPARKAAPRAGRHGLAGEREAVDLDVDVGVGRAHDDDGGRRRIGGGGGVERGGGALRGEGQVGGSGVGAREVGGGRRWAGGRKTHACLSHGVVRDSASRENGVNCQVRARLVTKNFHLEICASLFEHIYGVLNVVKQQN